MNREFKVYQKPLHVKTKNVLHSAVKGIWKNTQTASVVAYKLADFLLDLWHVWYNSTEPWHDFREATIVHH